MGKYVSRRKRARTHIYVGTHIFPIGDIAKRPMAAAQGRGQKCKVKP